MLVKLYLDEQTAIVLRMFGTINDVVNRIIDEGMAGKFDMFDKPVAPPRDDCSRYEVHINNEDYIQMMANYPEKSSKVSLRRLVTWFIDNAVYEELGWTISCDKRKRDNLVKKLDDVMNTLQKSMAVFPMVNHELFSNAINDCKKLQEKLYGIQ